MVDIMAGDNYAWVLPVGNGFQAILSYKNLMPIKKKYDDIDQSKYFLYNTRRQAVESLIKDWEDITVKAVWDELRAEPFLKWKNRKNLKQYIESRLVVVLIPFILSIIPVIKFRIKQFKKHINEEYPEWLI